MAKFDGTRSSHWSRSSSRIARTTPVLYTMPPVDAAASATPAIPASPQAHGNVMLSLNGAHSELWKQNQSVSMTMVS